ncbi:hypothetical protein BJ508DRAFT_327487 [Ascobolus immersus RN42]|uniref:Uncharacterized protein n=1 Tax=Ascobolus immersus RN42 TaxID=1160509 RepID=A0A3N4IFA0_ASCIM|nr:hypothetical protein BJ508DRAFT_327487 [Ascobolus immersus RN42]
MHRHGSSRSYKPGRRQRQRAREAQQTQPPSGPQQQPIGYPFPNGPGGGHQAVVSLIQMGLQTVAYLDVHTGTQAPYPQLDRQPTFILSHPNPTPDVEDPTTQEAPSNYYVSSSSRRSRSLSSERPVSIRQRSPARREASVPTNHHQSRQQSHSRGVTDSYRPDYSNRSHHHTRVHSQNWNEIEHFDLGRYAQEAAPRFQPSTQEPNNQSPIQPAFIIGEGADPIPREQTDMKEQLDEDKEITARDGRSHSQKRDTEEVNSSSTQVSPKVTPTAEAEEEGFPSSPPMVDRQAIKKAIKLEPDDLEKEP